MDEKVKEKKARKENDIVGDILEKMTTPQSIISPLKTTANHSKAIISSDSDSD